MTVQVTLLQGQQHGQHPQSPRILDVTAKMLKLLVRGVGRCFVYS